MPRPRPTEYDPFYSDYISCVPEGDVLETLRAQGAEVRAVLGGMSERALGHRYAPGKWTPRQILGHVIDAERIFSYRAVCFARGDKQALPGMDQDVFVNGADFDRRPVASLLAEHEHLRAANLALFESLDEATLGRTGVASDCTFTVRALIWIVAGHEQHHLQVLRERYDAAEGLPRPSTAP